MSLIKFKEFFIFQKLCKIEKRIIFKFLINDTLTNV